MQVSTGRIMRIKRTITMFLIGVTMALCIDFSQLRSAVNEKFYPLFWVQQRYLILYGSRGSGKSTFAAQKIIKRTMEESGHKLVCFRKVARTLRHSVFAELNNCISRWGAERLFKVNKTDMTLQFNPNGNTILCLGLDDKEKLKSLAGMTGGWIEEPTELTQNDVTEIDMCLRGITPNYKQLILSFNPIDLNHWIKARYFDRCAPAEAFRHHSTYKDNRWIDAEYAKILERLAEIDPTLHKIYALGLWGVLQNLIYTDYKIDNRPALEFKDEFYGLDIGYTHPSVLIHVGTRERDYYVSELIYQTHLTTDDLIERMKLAIPDKHRRRPIYVDSSEPETIEALQRAGFAVIAADKSVWDGILSVKTVNLHIDAGSDNLKKEISSYKWREDKNGRVLEEPVKIFDDGMDAMRYAIHNHLLSLLRGVSPESFKGAKPRISEQILSKVFDA